MIPYGPDQSAVAGKLVGAERPRLMKGLERNPPGVRDFRIGQERSALPEGKDERTDQNRRENGRSRRQIIERAQQRCGGEIDSDFFSGFPLCRFVEIAIARTPAAARKRELSGPAIALPLSATNQQQAVGIGCEDDGDSRSGPFRLVNRRGPPLCQTGGKVRDAAQCVWV